MQYPCRCFLGYIIMKWYPVKNERGASRFTATEGVKPPWWVGAVALKSVISFLWVCCREMLSGELLAAVGARWDCVMFPTKALLCSHMTAASQNNHIISLLEGLPHARSRTLLGASLIFLFFFFFFNRRWRELYKCSLILLVWFLPARCYRKWVVYLKILEVLQILNLFFQMKFCFREYILKLKIFPGYCLWKKKCIWE